MQFLLNEVLKHFPGKMEVHNYLYQRTNASVYIQDYFTPKLPTNIGVW